LCANPVGAESAQGDQAVADRGDDVRLLHSVTTPTRAGNMQRDNRLAYWRANLRLVAICLAIWFLCSYVFGILLVEELNAIRIGGFQLGFWFAQQGSIYVFVVLIFFYAWRMNKIDKKFDVHED
jgi:putative solute:sodium symporter small subunit